MEGKLLPPNKFSNLSTFYTTLFNVRVVLQTITTLIQEGIGGGMWYFYPTFRHI